MCVAQLQYSLHVDSCYLRVSRTSPALTSSLPEMLEEELHVHPTPGRGPLLLGAFATAVRVTDGKHPVSGSFSRQWEDTLRVQRRGDFLGYKNTFLIFFMNPQCPHPNTGALKAPASQALRGSCEPVGQAQAHDLRRADVHFQDSRHPWRPPAPWSFVGEQIRFAGIGRTLRSSQTGGNFPNLFFSGTAGLMEDAENQRRISSVEVKIGDSFVGELFWNETLIIVHDTHFTCPLGSMVGLKVPQTRAL